MPKKTKKRVHRKVNRIDRRVLALAILLAALGVILVSLPFKESPLPILPPSSYVTEAPTLTPTDIPFPATIKLSEFLNQLCLKQSTAIDARQLPLSFPAEDLVTTNQIFFCQRESDSWFLDSGDDQGGIIIATNPAYAFPVGNPDEITYNLRVITPDNLEPGHGFPINSLWTIIYATRALTLKSGERVYISMNINGIGYDDPRFLSFLRQFAVPQTLATDPEIDPGLATGSRIADALEKEFYSPGGHMTQKDKAVLDTINRMLNEVKQK